MLPKKFSFCLALPGFPLVIRNLTDNISYLLAIVINLIMYARIIKNLRRRASKDLGTGGQHMAQSERNQAARLLITNEVVFYLFNNMAVY